jgi:hypothetical protein
MMDNPQIKPRRRGRPTSKADPSKRSKSTLSVRVTPELKADLARAAKFFDRPLSQEAELRLELSLQERAHLDQALELLYGRQFAGVLMVLADAMRRAGGAAMQWALGPVSQRADWSGWLNNPYAFDQAMLAAALVLDAMRPAGDPDPAANGVDPLMPFEGSTGRWMSNVSLQMAAKIDFDAMDAEERESDFVRTFQRARELLGPIAARIRTHAPIKQVTIKEGAVPPTAPRSRKRKSK